MTADTKPVADKSLAELQALMAEQTKPCEMCNGAGRYEARTPNAGHTQCEVCGGEGAVPRYPSQRRECKPHLISVFEYEDHSASASSYWGHDESCCDSLGYLPTGDAMGLQQELLHEGYWFETKLTGKGIFAAFRAGDEMGDVKGFAFAPDLPTAVYTAAVRAVTECS